MGHLGIPTIPDNKNSMYKNRNYTNPDAVERLIRYITRTRANENRAGDLVCYGAWGAGYYNTPEDIIRQFLYVQIANKIASRQGRRMYHEVLNLYDCEAEMFHGDWEQLWYAGMECCQIYCDMGFQSVFAVHWEPDKHLHYHFAVNSVSYIDGRKWHTSLAEIQNREIIFNQILEKHQRMINDRISPIIIFNGNEKAAGMESRSPLVRFYGSPLELAASN